jgi:hypothetical protein
LATVGHETISSDPGRNRTLLRTQAHGWEAVQRRASKHRQLATRRRPPLVLVSP